MLNKGDCIRVQTRTKDDVFGVCFYEILETGLQAPEAGREKEKDGIKAVMIGGSGPAARPGFVVQDSQFKIAQDIASGITEVMPKEKAEMLLRSIPKTGKSEVGGQARPATGIVEMD